MLQSATIFTIGLVPVASTSQGLDFSDPNRVDDVIRPLLENHSSPRSGRLDIEAEIDPIDLVPHLVGQGEEFVLRQMRPLGKETVRVVES